MDNYAMFLRLPNGAYILLRVSDGYVPTQEMMFAVYGVRSKGKTVLIPSYIYTWYSSRDVADFILKKLGTVDRVFCLFSSERKKSWISTVKDSFKYSLKNVTKRLIMCDTIKWIRDNKIPDYQVRWFDSVLHSMSNNSKFLLGQVAFRQRLRSIDDKKREIEDSLRRKEEQLKNMREVDIENKTNIKNIERMKWIDKIDMPTKQELRILTKPMACTYVPNIGEYILASQIEKEDILYRIMKYQLMGKYFIILPDYYIIQDNYYITADSNTRYPRSRVRHVMEQATYFHGQACHIGNGSACLGELSTAVSQAAKTGLDMLLMSFEVYLRSINLTDAAGQRYYCLPMGDADGNIEVWPYVETVMKSEHISFKNMSRTLENYEKILDNPKMSKYNESFGKFFEGSCSNLTNPKQNMMKCIELIKSREPALYDDLERKGAFAKWQ